MSSTTLFGSLWKGPSESGTRRNASLFANGKKDSGFLGLGSRILFGGISEACLLLEGCLLIPLTLPAARARVPADQEGGAQVPEEDHDNALLHGGDPEGRRQVLHPEAEAAERHVHQAHGGIQHDAKGAGRHGRGHRGIVCGGMLALRLPLSFQSHISS